MTFMLMFLCCIFSYTLSSSVNYYYKDGMTSINDGNDKFYSSSRDQSDLSRKRSPGNEVNLPVINYYDNVNGTIKTAYYIEATSDQHDAAIDKLRDEGYRLSSMKMYDNQGNPNNMEIFYGAMFIKMAGPVWKSYSHLSKTKFFNKITQEAQNGYVPTKFTAIGAFSSPLFSVVFEKISAPGWSIKLDLIDGDSDIKGTLSEFTYGVRDTNHSVQHLATYGEGKDDRAYVALALPNPTGARGQSHWVGDHKDQYTNAIRFYSEIGIQTVHLSCNLNNTCGGVFNDNSYGKFITLTNLNKFGLDSAMFTYVVQQNYFPISIDAGGSGSKVRFNAIFAEFLQPRPRIWHEVHNVGANYSLIHNAFKRFMQLRAVRTGAISVYHAGNLVIDSAYTFAEDDYPTRTPDTLVRIASVGKMLTNAAIYILETQYGLDINTHVFPYLGITKVAVENQHKDNRVDDITIKHCMEHRAGWSRDIVGDRSYDGREIVYKLKLPGKPSAWDIVRFMYGEPLQNEPGNSTPWTVFPGYTSTPQYYSNLGYIVLGLVIEKATNMSYFDFINQTILTPLNIQEEIKPAYTNVFYPNEGRYTTEELFDSVMHPYSDDIVPYSRGVVSYEDRPSSGGIVGTMRACTKTAHNYHAYGYGGRSNRTVTKNGVVPGSHTRCGTIIQVNADYTTNLNTDPSEYPLNQAPTITNFNTEIVNAIIASFGGAKRSSFDDAKRSFDDIPQKSSFGGNVKRSF